MVALLTAVCHAKITTSGGGVRRRASQKLKLRGKYRGRPPDTDHLIGIAAMLAGGASGASFRGRQGDDKQGRQAPARRGRMKVAVHTTEFRAKLSSAHLAISLAVSLTLFAQLLLVHTSGP
jgi:hypothetical protein